MTGLKRAESAGAGSEPPITGRASWVGGLLVLLLTCIGFGSLYMLITDIAIIGATIFNGGAG